MQIFFLILAGLASGVLGGMGMGGGTVLIPVLTLGLKFPQHLSQSTNLLSFLPMSIVSLILHIKNKLVNFKAAGFMAAGGVIFSVVGAYLAAGVNRILLKKLFGGFLILLAAAQAVTILVGYIKNRRKSKAEEKCG